MQAHYRSVLDISDEAMQASEKGFNRLMQAMQILENIQTSDKTDGFDVAAWKDKCYAALKDDFNSPILIAHLFEAVNFIFKLNEKTASVSAEDHPLLQDTLRGLVFDVLGLKAVQQQDAGKLDQAMQVLIDLRNQARKAKNFDLSDEIRDRLLAEGIELKDGREGTTYSVS